jgi:hypothetical protein
MAPGLIMFAAHTNTGAHTQRARGLVEAAIGGRTGAG